MQSKWPKERCAKVVWFDLCAGGKPFMLWAELPIPDKWTLLPTPVSAPVCQTRATWGVEGKFSSCN